MQYWLPAIGTFYFTVSPFWGLPNAEKVVGTIVALTTLLGVILGLSRRSYNNSDAQFDGSVVVTGNPEAPHTLVFNAPLAELDKKQTITLKVTQPPDEGRA